MILSSSDEQTIIAQCTPRASGAIALIRMSGADAVAIADAITTLASGKKLAELPSHTIHYGTISAPDTSTIIDTALIMLMRAPRTFTGQDTVEISCHNNQHIIQQIITLAILAGARMAQEGEFTKRAVLNGKIDLVQAEAINELIHAQTQMALKQSLAQLRGSFSSWLADIEKELLKALAFCQASFEFIDEEMEFGSQIGTMIHRVISSIAAIKKTFSQQQQIRQGVRIALIGSVNAGKSSLFNALLNQQRAIVTPIPGTTRDSIEAGLYKNGNSWTLVDTAGLRQTEDAIEQEGIARSFEEAHKADIILLVEDATGTLTAEEKIVYAQLQEKYSGKIIMVLTKCEENPIHAEEDSRSPSPPIPTSSKTRKNIDALEQAIEEKITALFAQMASPFLLNQRQYQLLLALETKLATIKIMLAHKTIAYELLAVHLNDAIAQLAELSGKEVSEASMDMVFREFCVGK